MEQGREAMENGVHVQTSDVIRRVLAGAAMVTMISLPFAGAAHAQDTDTDTDTDTDGGGDTTTSTTTDTANTATTSDFGALGGRLADTGDEWTVPGVIAGAGLALAFSARAIGRRLS
jgi:hypothetical protein